MKVFAFLLASACLFSAHTSLAQTSQTKSPAIKHVTITKPASASTQQRGYLGVALTATDDGVEINNVFPNTAAVKAGLQRGDLLVSINNQRISSSDDVIRAISSRKPGEAVTILYTRNGETRTTSAVLGKQSATNYTTNFDYSFNNYNINDNWGSQPVQTTAVSPCEQLRELKGTAFLGVWIESTNGKDGAYINGTIQNTGAESAGLQRGDVINNIDGQTIANYNECLRTIRTHKPGDVVTLSYTRNGETRSTTARLVSIGETKRELVKMLESQCIEKAPTTEPLKGAATEQKAITRSATPVVSPTTTITIEAEATQPVESETPVIKGDQLQENTPVSARTLSVAPNPATGVVNVLFRSNNDAPFTISVVDASGRAVMEQKVNSMSNTYSAPLDLTSLARGVYILNIRQGDAVYSEKVILQ